MKMQKLKVYTTLTLLLKKCKILDVVCAGFTRVEKLWNFTCELFEGGAP